jgi:hypothetical protein
VVVVVVVAVAVVVSDAGGGGGGSGSGDGSGSDNAGNSSGGGSGCGNIFLGRNLKFVAHSIKDFYYCFVFNCVLRNNIQSRNCRHVYDISPYQVSYA